MEPSRNVILITGGSGLIGRAVSARLTKKYDLVSFDKKRPKRPPSSDILYLEVDISSREAIRRALAQVRERFGERITAFIHLAAYYSFSGNPSPKYDEITVQGTETLVRELRSFAVEQFIFSSTMLVHAPTEPGRSIDENSPIDPRWQYPESKVDAEEAMKQESGGMPTVALRIAGVYDDRCHSIPLAQHIKRIYERQLASLLFPGDPTHGQAYVHLDDLVDAIALLVERRKALPRPLTLLIGEPESLSFNELQEEIGRLIHGKAWSTIQIPPFIAKAGAWMQEKMPVGEEPFIKPWMIEFADDHYALDVSKAEETLGWKPKRLLRSTLPKMIAALQSDPRRWYRENKLEYPGRVEGVYLAAKRHPFRTLAATVGAGFLIQSLRAQFSRKESSRSPGAS